MIVKGTREATAKTARHATEHTLFQTAQADTAHDDLLCAMLFGQIVQNIGNIAVLYDALNRYALFAGLFHRRIDNAFTGKRQLFFAAFVTLVIFPRRSGN